MSDFDKEAEREKLREKYEQDQDEREVAEKMSELLLQGATMTNAHCSACGDPIFRYDGQEFCATCERPVDRGESEDDENIEVTAPDEDARVKFGGDETADQPTRQQDAQTGSTPQDEQAQPTPQNGQAQATTPDGERSQAHTAGHTQQTPDQPQRSPQAAPATGGDVSPARESLVRTLTRFSQQAEAADDPKRASEYLAAAREAAQTLSALRQ
jgi:uncharacterized Zn finger protein (UPF0148 family)